MKIRLKISMEDDWRTVEVPAGRRLGGLAAIYQNEAPYRILLAKVNGVYAQLDEYCYEGDEVEFVDMRSHGGELAYQRALVYMFIDAVYDVLGVDVKVENPLNKGIFFTLDREEEITEEELKAVEEYMRDMSNSDKMIDYAEDDMSDLLGPRILYALCIDYFELRKYEEGVLVRFPYYDKPDVIPPYVDDYMLYRTFEAEQDWLDILKTPYLKDLNEQIKTGHARDLILLSEALHEKKIAEIADSIKQSGKRMVLIAGPSSSGKTTFAQRLCIQLRVVGLDTLYLGTDDYFLDRCDAPRDENGEYNFEDLDALDIDLLNRNMNDLLSGEEVDLPEFDFMEGKKIYGNRITRIDKNQIIVMEGIHALNDNLTVQIDPSHKFKIYISPLVRINIDKHNLIHSTGARMLRRMSRDSRSRGRSAAQTISEWSKVRMGEKKNIFPYNSKVDVLFNSVLTYELPLMRNRVIPMLKEIGPDQPEYCEALRIIEFLEFFEPIDDDSLVPNNSVAREFIGGGIFVK